jgi:hypothetical protein
LTLRVLDALDRDPLLAGRDIGVTVHGDVVVLWGPIASVELAGRAKKVVNSVDGVATVVNELSTESNSRIQEAPIIAALPPVNSATAVEPAQPASALTRLPAGSDGNWRSDWTARRPVTTYPRERSVASAAWHAPGQHDVTLGAPVAVAANARALAAAVEAARQARPGCRTLQAELNSDVVWLSGTAERWDDVLDLAKSVARLDGVKRVMLGNIRVSDLKSDPRR